MHAVPRVAAAAALACSLAGCIGGIDAGQARICRSVIPALNPSDAAFDIVRIVALASGEGVRVDYRARVPDGPSRSRFLECRFWPGQPGVARPWCPDRRDHGIRAAGRAAAATSAALLAGGGGRGGRSRAGARRLAVARGAAGRGRQPAARAVRAAAGRHLCAAGGGLFTGLRAGRAPQPGLRRAGGRERLCGVPGRCDCRPRIGRGGIAAPRADCWR